MRIERSITTVSWIPSDLLEGMGKIATRMKMAHNDAPPPDPLGPDIPAAIEELRQADGFRFANELRAYIDVDDQGRITDHGYCGGGVIGATRIAMGVGSLTVAGVKLADRQVEPSVASTSVTFTQTVGGRTGAPMPRIVKRPPFVQYHAPIVWTTLELTINSDGTCEGSMVGASGFPRHWVYDDAGTLIAKSSLAEYKRWMAMAFGQHTPWGQEDSPALVAEVESLLERELQSSIMHGGVRPEIRRVKAGHAMVQQGSVHDELYLLLNGVLVVEVDGEALAEVGPGTVLGERACLEGGARTATLRAVTDCKVAEVASASIDRVKLAALAGAHHRESADTS